jgi:hypothetical protein
MKRDIATVVVKAETTENKDLVVFSCVFGSFE